MCVLGVPFILMQASALVAIRHMRPERTLRQHATHFSPCLPHVVFAAHTRTAARQLRGRFPSSHSRVATAAAQLQCVP